MSTKFFVGQKDYIAKLNEIDDLFNAAIAAPGTTASNVAAAVAARDAAIASATAALASQNAAASSATTASTGATTATTKASEASTNASAVATAKTAVDTAAAAANNSAIAADASKVAAAASASAASASQTSVASTASAASTSASASAASATNAATSATNASTSASGASGSASAASTSATNAATSATTASTAATNANNSASAAAADRLTTTTARDLAVGSKDIAVTKAGEAATSASSAATSASNAQGFQNTAGFHATNTAASEAAAASSAAYARVAELNAAGYSSLLGNGATVAPNAAAASAAAATASTQASAAASSAAQARTARDLALTAWAASTYPMETLAAISKTVHHGAVVKALIYDTGKDSDGGAWRKRCQDKSWFTESIYGAWLGQATNELAARGDNLVTAAEQVDHANWGKANSTVTPNVLVAPDGTTTLDKIVENSTNAQHYVYTAYTKPAVSGVFAFAVTLAAGERTSAEVWVASSNLFNRGFARFTLTGAGAVAATGVSGAGFSHITSSITALGNNTYRCVLVVATDTDTTLNSAVVLYNASNSYLGDGVSGVYLGQAKLNQVGVLPSTYSASPELVSNGGFDNGTAGWSATTSGASTIVASNGSVTFTGDGTNAARLSQSFATQVGKVYRLEVVGISGLVGSGLGTIEHSTNLSGNASVNINGVTVSYVFTATTTTSWFYLFRSTAGAGSIDSVSIKEVTTVATPYVPYSALANSYYQNTTDGKYYALNSTYGQTEVFRGNVREFPEQVGIFVEAARVVIYDLTQVGCPMWMVCKGVVGALGWIYGTTISTAFAINGILYVGTSDSNGALSIFEFLTDTMRSIVHITGADAYSVGISRRNVASAATPDGLRKTIALVSRLINDVTATVLDNAPIDPATGLPVPTVAVATMGGLSVIRDDGVAVNITGAHPTTGSSIVKTIKFNSRNNIVASYSGITNAIVFDIPAASSTTSTRLAVYAGASGLPPLPSVDTGHGQFTAVTSGNLVLSAASGIFVLKESPAIPAKSMVAHITNAFNTGWQVGDARLTTLADTTAETLTAPELVTNGIFDTDAAGWVAQASTLSVVAGAARITNTTSGGGQGMHQTLTLVAGKTYSYRFTIIANSAAGKGYSLNIGASPVVGIAAVGAYSGSFVATANSVSFLLGTNSTALAGEYLDVDNISVKLAASDRSVKANGLSIFGSITKAPVAAGANLVGYSGWSAANYLQQLYSTNFDFGTGEWSFGAWANFPATSPVPGNYPIVSAELMPNGDFNSGSTNWAATNTDATHIVTFANGAVRFQSDTTTPNLVVSRTLFELTAGKIYELTVTTSAWVSGVLKTDQLVDPKTGGTLNFGGSVGTVKMIGLAGAGATNFAFTRSTTNVDVTLDSISIREVGPSIIAERSAPTGPSIKLGQDAAGRYVATAFDGTTTRTAVTTVSYNTGTMSRIRATYSTTGKLAISVNGFEVASATGTPLLTLNNSNAVLTIGNSRTLDAPFPGSLTLLKSSATVPSADQLALIYRTELPMFQTGAQCTIDGTSTAVTALAYDDETNLLHVGTSWGRSGMRDLVRVDSLATPVGAVTSLSAGQGSILTGGATAGRYYQPAMLLRDELRRKEEARKALGKVPVFFEFDAIAAQVVFPVPKGYTVKAVYSAGLLRRGGATKAYVVSNDGFGETVTFAAAPGATVEVSIMCVRAN